MFRSIRSCATSNSGLEASTVTYPSRMICVSMRLLASLKWWNSAGERIPTCMLCNISAERRKLITSPMAISCIGAMRLKRWWMASNAARVMPMCPLVNWCNNLASSAGSCTPVRVQKSATSCSVSSRVSWRKSANFVGGEESAPTILDRSLHGVSVNRKQYNTDTSQR